MVRVVVPAGEAAKSVPELGRVAEELAGAGLDRGSACVALGGGVVGDLAGFVGRDPVPRRRRACRCRPPLLAMIDSAIGGKTGINLAAGKNLLGAFWQPRLRAGRSAVLATLPAARAPRRRLASSSSTRLLDGEDLLARVEATRPRIVER